MKLFLPWKMTKRPSPPEDMKLFLPKRGFRLEDSSFNTVSTPFFSLPTPSGILRFFLTALEKDAQEEALGYLSSSAAAVADFDGIKKFFEERKTLHYFSDELWNENRTVALTCKTDEGNTEVISVQMVVEPDRFGKWKINYIEKE